jgi:glycosyltransferase involved in cell wall biosynthesis
MPVFFIKTLGNFKPDIVHTQHPFLMGDTALRLAHAHNVPLVFTHHSLYEENIHCMPWALETIKKFMIRISTGYANLCDTVIAPSESVAELIKERGVKSPIVVIPTGLHLDEFTGTSNNFREETKIPEKTFVAGYVGRLAEEKNLPFLIRGVTPFLKKEKNALFLVVGSGPMEETISRYFNELGLGDQLRFAGEMKGNKLIEAYQAIDVFAFSSQSETQGMVLDEAMAAGTPVVAVDAPGVRDIVIDKMNGRLVATENEEDFSDALKWVFDQTPPERKKLIEGAKETAKKYSVEKSATKALAVYESLKSKETARRSSEEKETLSFFRHMNAEWDLFYNFSKSMMGALR